MNSTRGKPPLPRSTLTTIHPARARESQDYAEARQPWWERVTIWLLLVGCIFVGFAFFALALVAALQSFYR